MILKNTIEYTLCKLHVHTEILRIPLLYAYTNNSLIYKYVQLYI